MTSSIFALKNAAPADWREKVDHELAGPGGGPIKTEDATDPKKLARAVALLLAEGTSD